MGKFLAILSIALMVLGTLFAENSFARGRGGCNMQVQAAEIPQPIQAQAKNLTQTTATKIVAPSDAVATHSAPVLESKVARLNKNKIDLSALQAMNAPPKDTRAANVANVASK